MMTMMSRVQLCWFLNSVLHLIQPCPKNLSPNFSSLHCNVISFPTLHWIEMLLHCRLLCTWLCIALSWAEPQKRTMVKSTHVKRWLYHLIFFHWAALQALTLRLSQALVLLVACSAPSNNFLYGSHYTRDGHYHLGNRFPLQLLQKTPLFIIHSCVQSQPQNSKTAICEHWVVSIHLQQLLMDTSWQSGEKCHVVNFPA